MYRFLTYGPRDIPTKFKKVFECKAMVILISNKRSQQNIDVIHDLPIVIRNVKKLRTTDLVASIKFII